MNQVEMLTHSIAHGESYTFMLSRAANSVLLTTDKNVTVAWNADSIEQGDNLCVYFANERKDCEP